MLTLHVPFVERYVYVMLYIMQHRIVRDNNVAFFCSVWSRTRDTYTVYLSYEHPIKTVLYKNKKSA